MFDLTTIGEGQIRLTVPHGERLSRTRQLHMSAACSEANVSGLLAQLGRSASWCSVMPHGDLAERCLSEYRSVGVDMSNMIRVSSGRVAVYFMEPGETPMPSRVTYDREGTAFREIAIEDVHWESMLDTRMVFVTGITAALTPGTAAVVRHLVDAAAERGIDIAVDINYRSMLWSPDQARDVLTPIVRKAAVVLCSRRDAEVVFGITGARSQSSRNVREEFGVEHVVSTDQSDGVYYSGPDGEAEYDVDVVPVVDRPGAGDAFVAGTLHGFLDGDVRAGIGYGMRVARYALTHHGDLTCIAPSELAIPTSTDIIR
ncbi:MAG: sugar kinase [Cellulomonas sp.]|uniref:sugar kinase n=1 Tax=Cellulomonas sp. TaxID=40001 RepID=UPI001847A377|nr:sugar kinase [Cellulomonas sp.]NMM16721.1 sugar kinase [Cellulomonas sp.]NMM29525.1 sugar kinase [Cellulomonas sp.]